MIDLSVAVERTEGVRPAIQARSLKKRNLLLQEGMILMQEKPFDDISIKEICAHAHCTVGSFYSRFSDKESYFDAMLAYAFEITMSRAEELFTSKNWADQTGQQVAQAIVDFVLALFKQDFSSVMTEAFFRESRGHKFSTPINEVGQRFVQVISTVLRPHIDIKVHPQPSQAISFALQVLYSTLINASLRNTLIKMGTPEFEEQLLKMFTRYLGIR